MDIYGGTPIDTTIEGLDSSFNYTTLWTCSNPLNTIPAPSAKDLEQVAPGKYYLSITDKNGCTGTDSFVVSYACVFTNVWSCVR